jgi:MYXO-CTERM domain-containing protein
MLPDRTGTGLLGGNTMRTMRPLLACAAALAAVLAIAAPGDSRAQEIFKCSGGDNDGTNCRLDSDCPGGACAEARFVCLRGERDGERCDCPGSTCAGSTCAGGVRMGEPCDCTGGACEPTVQFCSIESPGDRAGAPCLSNAQCGEFLCSSTGRYCWGGSQFKLACLQDPDCEADGSFGTCSEPGTPVAITTLCSRGANNGAPCDENSECPGGACVLGRTLCDGGPIPPHGFCESDTDCEPGSPCTLTGRVCDGGLQGEYCIDASTCDGGVCVATGKYCDGGTNFACVNDDDCIDNGNCVSSGIGGPEPTATAIPRAGNDDDGCAVNPNASSSGSAVLLAVAVLAGALRRRRH